MKASRPSDPRPAVGLPGAPPRRRTRRRRFFLWILRFLGLAVALLALTLSWLHVRGVPRFAQDAMRRYFQQTGMELQFARLRLTWGGDLIADRARVLVRDAVAEPLFEAERLVISLDWTGLLRGRTLLAGVRLQEGRVRLTEEPATPSALPRGLLDLRCRDAVFRAEPDGLRVVRLETRAAGMDWHAQGFVAGFGMRRAHPPPVPVRERLQSISRTLALNADRLAPFLKAANAQAAQMTFDAPPTMQVDFLIDTAEPERTVCRLRGGGGTFRYRGMPFDAWDVEADWQNGLLTLRKASLRHAKDYLELAACIEVETRQLRSGSVQGLLPLRSVWNLPLPEAVGRWRQPLRLIGREPIEFALEAGPIPLAEAIRHWKGRVAFRRLEALGIPIEAYRSDIARDGDRLRLARIDALIGQGRKQGPLRGEGSIDLVTRRYEGRAHTGFDPTLLLPLAAPSQALYLGAAVLQDRPPEGWVDFTGRVGSIRDLCLTGTVSAAHFVYNGSAVEQASASLYVSNQVFHLDRLFVQRPEGELRGRVTQDFQARQIDFDVVSELHPPAIGRMIGPFPHRFAQFFRFEDGVHIEAAGRVDYGAQRANDFCADVRGTRMGLKGFLADRVAFRCRMVGRHVELNGIEGEIYGGTFSGRAVFDLPEDRAGHTAYAVKGRADGLDFRQLARAVRHNDVSSYEGTLSTELDLKGFIGVGQGKTATGEGRLEIKKGSLLEIPLFGGLSRYLAMLYPGLGFASQSDFRSEFTLADGRFTTERAELEGGLLTVRAKGTYRLDERLDFVVHVKLLRNSLVARVLRLVTYPITKLFEFKLEGTLSNPHWEPRNLPKELLLQFD